MNRYSLYLHAFQVPPSATSYKTPLQSRIFAHAGGKIFPFPNHAVREDSRPSSYTSMDDHAITTREASLFLTL